MRVLFYISLIGILFFGCTKAGKNISVRGRVYNPVTNEGIPNIEIRLLKDEGVPSLSGGSEAVKTVYTDANGYYELDHVSISSRYVGCFLDNNQYYRIGWIYEGENIGKHTTFVNKGKYTYLDYQVVPYGKIKANVNNISCEGSTDVININVKYLTNPGDQIFQPGTYYGCVNLSSTPTEIPMGYYEYTWSVTKTSTGTNTFTQEVFVPTGGIGEITIDY